MRHRSIGVFVLVIWAPIGSDRAIAQVPETAPEIFRQWCAGCHAPDGSGRVEQPTVKTEPMDFTDCKIASPEPDADWEIVIARGGLAAGLSPEMPAFGDALRPDQVQSLIGHIRSFCAEPGWPHGNLNFPRAIFTEKAYPENEVVILPAVSHEEATGTGLRMKTVYERRVGKRAHVEVGIPIESQPGTARRESGFGDLTFAGKYVLLADSARTRILTAGLEVVLPTGSERRGLGGGTAVFEPYLSAGTILRDVYVQTQLKLELPRDEPWGDRELVYNAYVGRDTSVAPDTWTIGVELNGANREVALTPQVRKALTRTGALGAAFGVRVPIVNRADQHVSWVGYLLWEYLEPVLPRR